MFGALYFSQAPYASNPFYLLAIYLRFTLTVTTDTPHQSITFDHSPP